jgi:integrase
MSLFKRDSGYYGFDARDQRLPNGRLAISLRTKDRAEAKRRARALSMLLERGEIAVLQRIRAGDLHVSEVANAFRNDAVEELRGQAETDLSLGSMIERVMAVKRATRSESTISHYDKITTAMRRKWGADRSILEISRAEGEAWLYEPKRQKRKGAPPRPWMPNTQQGAHMVAAFLWKMAIDLELETAERVGIKPRITRNPWAKIEPASQRTTRHAFLSPAEWGDLLRVVEGRPQAAFLALGCLAGLRIREVMNLRTSIDVVLTESPLLHVQSREGEFAWKPKHQNSERRIPMPNALRDILTAHVESGFAGSRYFIHAPDRDQPISYDLARLWTLENFGRAGLKYGREGDALTFHSLRHSFASHLIKEGWSATLVARLMGNTSLEVERTYAHLFPDDLSKVIRSMDDYALNAGPDESPTGGKQKARKHADN